MSAMYSGGRGHLLESKVTPLYVQHCFLTSGVPDEVPPPPLMSGVEEEQEEGGKTLSLMSFNYFLLAFLGGFQQHPGNRGRALSGSLYSLAGS